MPGDRDKLQQLAQFYRGPPRLFRNREEERWWSDKDAGLIVEAREEGHYRLCMQVRQTSNHTRVEDRAVGGMAVAAR